MATATERAPVPDTAAEKRHIAKIAKSAGVSMGESLRRAAVSVRSSDDDQILEEMIDQMNKPLADRIVQ